MRKFIKSILPKQLLVFIKRNISLSKEVSLWIFSRNPVLSSIYYLFVSDAFRKEHQSVAYGRYKYIKNLRILDHPKYGLRRNIHRLEKGIITKPKRESFGLDYIEETVNIFLKVRDEPGYDQAEVEWAENVLTQYFSTITNDPRINNIREKFKLANHIEPDHTDDNLSKYTQLELDETAYHFLLKLATNRKSVRWFLDKPIPKELIDRAINVARQSPSACNRQPFEFRVYDDRKLVRQIARLPLGTVGFHDNIPTLVAIIGHLNAFALERDRHLIYIDSALATMSFIFALETLGVSSCILNWPDIPEKEKQISTLLSLDPDERPILLIALGFYNPESYVATSQKKSIEHFRSYNKK